MCSKLHGLKDGLVVMDPFQGIGSTIITTNKLGLSFIRFKINKGYVDGAVNMLNYVK